MSDLDFKAAFLGYEEGDLPLLEELGINFKVIKQQIMSIYFLRKTMKIDNFSNYSSQLYENDTVNQNVIENDLTGPLIFLIVLCLALLLQGKVLFGCVYFLSIGLAVITQIMISCMNYTDETFFDNKKENKPNNHLNLQNNMSNESDTNHQTSYSFEKGSTYDNSVKSQKDNMTFSNEPLSFLQITSVLGYSLLPVVIFAFLNVIFSRFHNFMLFLGFFSAFLSAVVSNRKLNGGWLIYTLWITYMAYVVLTLY
ncbi:hypothetical protein M153_5908000453 [Pseudoloma neurophilia]|uniref:Uncharacterized protein n=1 Tax=Pseudoloma neurophilia TaxID=146866 RepID=A0A0R0M0C5_9MICR|nr:hypothetical protein M153_5908000453 [Pseudoloma neurophilia]